MNAINNDVLSDVNVYAESNRFHFIIKNVVLPNRI